MSTIRAFAIAGVMALAVGGTRRAAADPVCHGDYAEDRSAMSAAARTTEAETAAYSYAVRTTAVYECVAYGDDGNLHRTQTTTMAYGTAFGLRPDGNDTLLLTNEHVAEWPAVSTEEHPVDGVAVGCKRVSDALAIVDNDHDEYAGDDIPLERVVVDPALDIGVLRAHAKLQVLPWKIGHSAGVSAGDSVEVRGFPLGEFRATNVGKVIAATTRDVEGHWDHDDFIIDALLSSGGSGSPVLAISCKTGELELVGIFHARYTAASALNAVIAIDQLHDILTTLKLGASPAPARPLDGAARTRLVDLLRADPDAPFFAIGQQIASLRIRADGTLVFALFAADFPRTPAPLLVLEDRPATVAGAFGALGTIYVATHGGLQATAGGDPAFAHALDLMRNAALARFAYRSAARTTISSRDAAVRLATMRHALARTTAEQREAVAAIADSAARATPIAGAPTLTLATVEAGPATVAAR